MDPQTMALAQAMMGRGGMQGGGMMHGGMGGMAQGDPDPAQPQPDAGLWAKLMALFRGQPVPQGDVPQYQPLDTLPPDARAQQLAKEEILRKAMMGVE